MKTTFAILIGSMLMALTVATEQPVSFKNLEKAKASSISSIKKLAIFLDYDGTLSKIVNNPEEAKMTTNMKNTLSRVSENFPTAIVTGRSMETIRGFVEDVNMNFAAGHGCDIQGPAIKTKEVGEEYVPLLKKMEDILLSRLSKFQPRIENNRHAVTVHYREIREKKCLDAIAKIVKDEVNKQQENLQVKRAEQAWEIRPNFNWDKGAAIQHFLEKSKTFKNRVPIYIGDCVTDEVAFKKVNELNGISILVTSTREAKPPTAENQVTHAQYKLSNPDEVASFLASLRK